MEVQSKVHNDKIYKQLDDKGTRKKTLEGRLERTNCENQEVFEFLKLLKRKKHNYL